MTSVLNTAALAVAQMAEQAGKSVATSLEGKVAEGAEETVAAAIVAATVKATVAAAEAAAMAATAASRDAELVALLETTKTGEMTNMVANMAADLVVRAEKAHAKRVNAAKEARESVRMAKALREVTGSSER